MGNGALVKVEGEHLSAAELAFVRTWRKLENPSQAKVARALNLNTSTVSRHAAKSNVANALAKAEQRSLDKARGTQGAILTALGRCQRLLEGLSDAQLTSDVATLLGSTKILMELAEKQQGLVDAGVFQNPKDTDRHEQWKRRFLRWAYALGSRRLLGWRPQDVVVKPD